MKSDFKFAQLTTYVNRKVIFFAITNARLTDTAQYQLRKSISFVMQSVMKSDFTSQLRNLKSAKMH